MELLTIKKFDHLVKDISTKLLLDENIKELTSDSINSIIKDQVRYFLSFLIRSIEEENQEVLFSLLPWMYHAYLAQGFSQQFFLLEIDIISDNITTHLDEYNTKEAIKILEEIKQKHKNFIVMADLYHSITEDIPQEYKGRYELYKNALFSGDIDQSKEIFEQNVSNYSELQNFYQFIIVPSMNEIGIAWENGLITPAEEHLASAIVVQTMALLYTKLTIPSYYKGKAVVGAVANEFHEIGAMMLANSLEADGWSVNYLGPNASDEKFIKAIKQDKPEIVALSVAMPFNIVHAKELITKIIGSNLEQKPHIMIGGSAFMHNENTKSSCGADSYLQNVDDGVRLANLIYEQSL